MPHVDGRVQDVAPAARAAFLDTHAAAVGAMVEVAEASRTALVVCFAFAFVAEPQAGFHLPELPVHWL